jgi:RNA polymerase sigma factor (sigma-70 family)
MYWRMHRGEIVSLEIVDSSYLSDSAETAAAYDQLLRLRAAVEQLPAKLKEAVVLHYMQQLTIAEAAEAARVKQGTLKSRLNRALTALKKRLMDDRIQEDGRRTHKRTLG